MPRSRSAVLIAFALCIAIAPPAWTSAGMSLPVRTPEGAESFRIVAGPLPRKGADHAAPVGRVSLNGLIVVAEYLEPAPRAAFIRTLDPTASDPFASSGDRSEGYNAFRVEFDNRSPADVTFQPGNVILMTDRGDQLSPIDLTDLYRRASIGDGSDPQAAMDRAKPFIFDSSTTIPRGRRLERLLVFGALPRRWKELRLDFSFLQIGTDTRTVSLSFHKQA